jgi:nucleotide-binding universal stress UspA family protein
MRLERAVVGIDLSPTTDQLLQELRHLKRLGVKQLTLVTVLGGPYPQAPEERHRDHYETRLEELATQIDGLEVSVEVRSGRPSAELQRAADQTAADLIVAGSHGHTPLRDLFLGSTVLDLARTSRRPLLLFPLGDPRPDRGGGVLLATDGSISAEPAEQLALELGRDLGGSAVTVIIPSRDGEDREKQAQDHLDQLVDTVLVPRVEHGPKPETITALADEQAADVIVVGARGRNPLAALLLGSTAEHVLRTSRRPVLLVPGPG